VRWILVLGALVGCGFEIRAAPGAQIDAPKTVDAVVDAPPEAMVDAMIDAPVTMNCMQNPLYVDVGTTRYRQLPGVAHWLAAELLCEGDGSHLVVFNNSAERGAADGAIIGDAWLGVTDRVLEGTYRPVNGQSTVFVGTFMAITPSEDCLQFDEGIDAIDDENCDTNASIVCECDGLAVIAGSY
jgi:hypothetical protein